MNIDLNGNTLIQGYFSGIGEELTALNASNLTTGTVPDARLSTDVTLQGNTFNAANQLVQLDSVGAVAIAGYTGTPSVSPTGCPKITVNPGGGVGTRSAQNFMIWMTDYATGNPGAWNFDNEPILRFPNNNQGEDAGYLVFYNKGPGYSRAGRIDLRGGTYHGTSAYSGDISMGGGSAADTHGGAVVTDGGSVAGAHGGELNLRGGSSYPGGSINLSNGGGTIALGTGNTLTLPNATGTVALQSDITGYLPLSGGTLSGSLNITPATGEASLKIISGDTDSYLQLGTAGTSYWTFFSGADTDFQLAGPTGSNLRISRTTGFMSFYKDAAFSGALSAGTFSGSGSGLTGIPLSGLASSGASSGEVPVWNGTAWVPGTTAGSGTVTSVGLSIPSVLGTVSGSPVTGSGTLAITAPTMATGAFIASPAGTSGTAVARTIVASDIFSILSAAMDTAFGSAQGNVLQRTASGWSVLAPGTAGQVLTTNGAGANAVWAASGGGTSVQVPVRQTALSGAVNATGQGNCLTTGSGFQPGVTTNAGSDPLTLAFASGFGSSGNVDYVEQITADQATYWSALPANNLSFLAITRTGVGSLSPYATLAPPQYGYAYNPTAQTALSLNNKSTDDFGNAWTNASVTFTGASPQIAGTQVGVFNGSSSRMSSTSFTTLGVGGWALRGWFKMGSLASPQGLFQFCNSANNLGAAVLVSSSGKTQLNLSSNNSSWDIANSTAGSITMTTGTWYFVELTFDSVAGKYVLYINGVADQTITSTSRICRINTGYVGFNNPTGTNTWLTGNAQGFEFLPYCQHPNGTTYSVPTALADVTAAGYASDWFDISFYTLKRIAAASASSGVNPTFAAVNRVYVGEATTGASTVSSIVTYAYQGKYSTGFIPTLPGLSAAVSYNHNIGTNLLSNPLLSLKCLTADQSYVAGDIVTGWGGYNPSPDYVPVPLTWTSKTIGFSTMANQAWKTVYKTGGSIVVITNYSYWAYQITVQRGF
ncbi:hypothetical protein SAMN05444156_0515 [Verrucomicrobium sp. GAS474]|uniref:hypothetical protein n=1 Tax=Verrucomicrobium sp. GAS474 TaxID=1882831 RepID=UPI00087B44DD|nr:hypothetical protein [Verrucomicrobium sp. GAS474]SDT89530.1 hypothetical protein SAMN05444156_0515 [Verrucomicrobium sp. GAS474]